MSLERLADGDGRERLEPGAGRGRQLVRRRQDLVEVLGNDVGDRLAPESGVQDVCGDLRVERDGRRRGVLVVGEPGDEDRLHLVRDEGHAGRLHEVAQRVRRLRAVRRDHASVRAREGQGERRSPPRPGVVGDERCPEGGLLRDPGCQVRDPVRAADLDPPRVDDRSRERGGKIAGRLKSCAIARLRGAGPVAGRNRRGP
jgi:hypothetical protein